MKLAYQVATPEVKPSPSVTAYQSDMATSFRRLREIGYDGAELMVANPAKVDPGPILELAEESGLAVPMVCTGEIYGQDKVSFSDPDPAVRDEAVRRGMAAIDLAAAVCGGAGLVNIGRLRGGIVPGIPPEQSRGRVTDAFLRLCDHAEDRGVVIALEPVNTLGCNFINSTREGLETIRGIGRSCFRLMLDTMHMFLEDADIAGSVRDSAGAVAYVHLTDSNRRYPGHCKFDFPGFLAELAKTGYDGWVGVEVFQLPDQDTALEKSFRYVKPLLP